VILSDEEMEFVNKIKKKYELRSQGVSIRFLIQEAMTEADNPDQKYRDLLSQNDEFRELLVKENKKLQRKNFN
jgi:hypothetical protein